MAQLKQAATKTSKLIKHDERGIQRVSRFVENLINHNFEKTIKLSVEFKFILYHITYSGYP